MNKSVNKKRETTAHTKTITKPSRKLPLFAGALLAAVIASPALAQFISNSVTIASNTVSTADLFPSPNPSSSPAPTTSPSTSLTTSPSPSPSGTVLGNCDVNLDVETNLSNTNTGPGSTSTNHVEVQADCQQTEDNQAEISNTANIEANTGNNQQNQNTEEGDLETGDVTIDLNVDTSANTQ